MDQACKVPAWAGTEDRIEVTVTPARKSQFGHPLYYCWVNMIKRCTRPKHKHYHYYGGRGIKVCQRWRYSFPCFVDDMGLKPTPDHSLDRIDNDGDYSPENCRWATKVEQARSRRNTKRITFQGESLSMREWGRRLGFGSDTVRNRLDSGWSVERALSTPIDLGRQARQGCVRPITLPKRRRKKGA